MRKQKVITIDDRKITLKEFTVREIRTFWQEMEHVEETPGLEGTYAVLVKFMPQCVEGITVDQMEDMTPSEIKQIYDAFEEVNDTFFGVTRQIQGENPLLVGLRKAVVPVLMLRFAELMPLIFPPAVLSALDTLTPGATDTASSAQPSES